MRKPTVIILIDAFRWDYIELHKSDILENLRKNNFNFLRGKTRETFGFHIKPAFFSGIYPEESNLCTTFIYSPSTSPFKILRLFPPFLFKLFSSSSRIDTGIRKFLIRRIRRRSSTAEKYYATTLQIPLYLLHFFDFSEKEFPEEGYNGYATVLSILKEKGFKYKYYGFPFDCVSTFEADLELLCRFKKEVKNDIVFAFIQFSSLDLLGHIYGPVSKEVKEGVKKIDELVEEIILHCNKIYKEGYNLIIFSDHGMVEIREMLNIWQKLEEEIDLKLGKDYVVFLDSTMARFWFKDERAEREIKGLLQNLPGGRILEEEDYVKYRIRFRDNRYGDLIFLANPGVLIYPNFFQMSGEPCRGMHGYDPEEPDNQGVFLLASSRIHEKRYIGSINLVDLFPTILELMELPVPGYNKGEAIFKKLERKDGA